MGDWPGRWKSTLRAQETFGFERLQSQESQGMQSRFAEELNVAFAKGLAARLSRLVRDWCPYPGYWGRVSVAN
jgi:hypothetical protein